MDSPRDHDISPPAAEQEAASPASESASPHTENVASTHDALPGQGPLDERHSEAVDTNHDDYSHTVSSDPSVREAEAQDTPTEGEASAAPPDTAIQPEEDDPYDSPGAENNIESTSPPQQEDASDGEEANEPDTNSAAGLDDRAGSLAISGNNENNDNEETNFPSFPERTVSLRTQLLERGFVPDPSPMDTDRSVAQEQGNANANISEDNNNTRERTTAETVPAYSRRSSSSRHGHNRHGNLYRSGASSFSARERQRREAVEYSLPRWQPDAEVTYCPICNAQFSIFVRKHHCRKCGRVVCNSCSPHRIIIPHQYIVRPPGYEMPYAPSLFMDSIGSGYLEAGRMPGGERVRLCNPCVPDPNPDPPTSPTPRSPHQRSRSSISGGYGGATDAGRFAGFVNALPGMDPGQYQSARSRSITMQAHGQPEGSSGTARSASYQTPYDRYMRPSSLSSAMFNNRRGLYGDVPTSSRHRALPPTPQIAEEDECPVCHRELPQRSLPNYESLREAHITNCIQSHSTYGSPRGAPEARPNVAPRRSGMYTYAATEKDCVDDAECTICLEEFTVGVAMARLECLCRFHRSCIAAWFVNHPGRCPVHQHDGFGF